MSTFPVSKRKAELAILVGKTPDVDGAFQLGLLHLLIRHWNVLVLELLLRFGTIANF